MFVNTYYVTDSSGALVPKSVADPELGEDTLYIAQSGVRRLGRSNCVVITATSHPDTTFISYANNGDVFLRNSARDSEWNKLSFNLPHGKKTTELLPNDTGTMYGRSYDMPHKRTTEVLGHDTASISGKIYDCIKLQLVDIRRYQGTDWLQGSLVWYSPELGYFVRKNTGWNGKYFLNEQLKVWQ